MIVPQIIQHVIRNSVLSFSIEFQNLYMSFSFFFLICCSPLHSIVIVLYYLLIVKNLNSYKTNKINVTSKITSVTVLYYFRQLKGHLKWGFLEPANQEIRVQVTAVEYFTLHRQTVLAYNSWTFWYEKHPYILLILRLCPFNYMQKTDICNRTIM